MVSNNTEDIIDVDETETQLTGSRTCKLASMVSFLDHVKRPLNMSTQLFEVEHLCMYVHGQHGPFEV